MGTAGGLALDTNTASDIMSSKNDLTMSSICSSSSVGPFTLHAERVISVLGSGSFHGTSHGGNIIWLLGAQSMNTLKSEKASPHALKMVSHSLFGVVLYIVCRIGHSYSFQAATDKPWILILLVE